MSALKETIYDLELHAYLSYRGMIITRVPGGWIYEVGDKNENAVFVPWVPENVVANRLQTIQQDNS